MVDIPPLHIAYSHCYYVRRLEGGTVDVGVRKNGHFSITLPPPVVETLDRMAVARGMSRSALVRTIVVKGIEREALIERIAEAVA